jgi:hypothetical protein
MTDIARKVKVKGLGTLRLRSSNRMLVMLSSIGLAFGAIILLYPGPPSPDSTAIAFQYGSGALVLAATIIFFVTPIFVGNLLTPSKLILRYGILFRLEIFLSNISEVETLDRLPRPSLLFGRGFRLGVEYSVIDRRFTVLRSKSGAMRIVLKDEVEGRDWFVQKRVEEIVFDTLDSAPLQNRLGGKQRDQWED